MIGFFHGIQIIACLVILYACAVLLFKGPIECNQDTVEAILSVHYNEVRVRTTSGKVEVIKNPVHLSIGSKTCLE